MKIAGITSTNQASRIGATTGRRIAQTRDADAARQSPLDGSLHEFGREEGERDRHIDLSNAAFLARGNLLNTGDTAGNDRIEPTSAARDRRD